MATPVSIISDIFASVDRIGNSFISSAYQGLAGQIQVILGSMLTLYLIWWGYQILSGRSSASPVEMAFRLMRVFFIVYFATNWPWFSETLYTAIQGIPTLISDTVINAIAGSSGTLDGGSSDTTGVIKILDAVYEAMMQTYDAVTSSAGLLSGLAGVLLGFLVLIVGLLFLAIAAAAIIAAKLMLFIALALSPVFIILAVYGYTYRFTEGWITLIVQLMVSQILIYVYLAFYYSLIATAITTIQNDGTGADNVALIAPFLLVSLIGVYFLHQIPMIATTIVGGSALQTTGGWSGMVQSARNAGRRSGINAAGRAAGRDIKRQAGANYNRAVEAIRREVAKNSRL